MAFTQLVSQGVDFPLDFSHCIQIHQARLQLHVHDLQRLTHQANHEQHAAALFGQEIDAFPFFGIQLPRHVQQHVAHAFQIGIDCREG